MLQFPAASPDSCAERTVRALSNGSGTAFERDSGRTAGIVRAPLAELNHKMQLTMRHLSLQVSSLQTC